MPSPFHSPSQSLAFLPSGAYVPPSSTHDQPHHLNEFGTSDPMEDSNDLDDSTNPDDFYKTYQTLQAPVLSGALHQSALRPANAAGDMGLVPQHVRDTSSPFDNQGQEFHFNLGRGELTSAAGHGHSSSVNNLDGAGPWEPPNQRRKSSFKDLVARFDQDTDDSPPPMPSLRQRQASVGTSQEYARPQQRNFHQPTYSRGKPSQNSNLSNVSHSAAAGYQRQPGQLAITEAKSRRWTSGASQASPELGDLRNTGENVRNHRPLFGEISTDSVGANVGYGIITPRRRSGSVGSPMHSPNPMFPSPFQHPESPIARSTQNQDEGAEEDLSLDFHDSPRMQRPLHQRAHSDFDASTVPVSSQTSRIINSQGSSHEVSHTPDESRKRRPSQSRIPVRTPKHSVALESEPVAVHNTHLNQYHRVTPSGRVTSPGQRKTPSPRRSAQRRSPTRTTKSSVVSPGQKSPLLRANIVALPPKVSPPLRSSRPRQPVSVASTAASRSKVADRYAALARQHNDKVSSHRVRPPELADIDLKARRLRITQALSRSLEGQDLRPGRSKTTSRESSLGRSIPENEDIADPFGPEPPVPPVMIEHVSSYSDGERETYGTPAEHSGFANPLTHSALQALHDNNAYRPADQESSTFSGQPRMKVPPPIRTDLLRPAAGDEPLSAISRRTAETEGTIFDGEAQGEEFHGSLDIAPPPEDSLLSRIMHMRGQSPASSIHNFRHSPDELEDHEQDRETVEFMIRETQLFDDSAPAHDEIPLQFFPEQEGDFTESGSIPGQSSWPSSTPPVQLQSGVKTVDDAIDQPQFHIDLSSREFQRQNSNITDREPSTLDSRASNAYTIINIFLQQQSPTGIVNQEVVDNIYDRVITEEPELAVATDVNNARLESMVMQYYQVYRGEDGVRLAEDQVENKKPDIYDEGEPGPAEPTSVGDRDSLHGHGTATVTTSLPLPPKFRGHRHKSSLDSPDDWADTSPSVGWIPYAIGDEDERHLPRDGSALAFEARLNAEGPNGKSMAAATTTQTTQQDAGTHTKGVKLDLNHSLPAVPSESPPPPPPISKDPVVNLPPLVPRRTVSLSQNSANQTIVESLATSPASSEIGRKEHRRLNQRKNIMKELVDTEYTYERDMRVLCDIYRQTASVALSEEDVRILFGNIDQIQQFAKEFLTILKQVVKPSYTMDRSDRKKDMMGDSVSGPTQTPPSRTASPALSDLEKDMLTRVGEAFATSTGEMEKVYTDYIRTRHAANKRLELLQTSAAVREWLRECSENSSDLTNAWSLDALLVKPIQRITKYPLLLNQLLEATPETHPDYTFLREVATSITEINVRINEVKKHTELIDSVLSRKRKDSDVRSGLTKAFGRRAEKLRQHVGMTEMHEDNEYTKLKIDFDNNTVHLFLVSKDCQGYLDALRGWVQKMCEMAAAIEAWLDVGHSRDYESESKLRQFAMIVRGISSIALPDHTEQVLRRVIQPMDRAYTYLQRFEQDPKGLIQKRDKKLIDYAPLKNRRDRGEKLDRRTIEKMEQWEALNVEAKERIKKLIRTTADLVLSCQMGLTQLHMSWLKMCTQKFGAARAIAMDKLDDLNIVSEWQVEFLEHEGIASVLSICNGSLLREVTSMFNYLSPGTTLNGDDSPRQPSWTSTNRRTTSMNSTGSHVFGDLEFTKRHSREVNGSQVSLVADRTTSVATSNGRIRATSTASGPVPPRTPEINPRMASLTAPTTTGQSSNIPPVPQLNRYDENHLPVAKSEGPPRLSVDTPSPLIGSLNPESPNARPSSSATYFSALTIPESRVEHRPHLELRRLNTDSIFSSAMPLSDSPAIERPDSSFHQPQAVQSPPPPPPPPAVQHQQHQLHAFVEPKILFTAASVFEFNIDRARQEAGWPYLTYVMGEIFDIIAERGELWLARNQDDPSRQLGWIWNKHFAKLAG